MAKAPERLGKYYILGLIAEGGMAEVYKAKTIGIAGFEKILALKRIRPRYASEARFIRNFTDEARIAVTLNHRNIVQVFDFSKADGELFLAMELLDGVDLRTAMQALKRGERIPDAISCYILSEVASGLDYAHRKTDHDGTPLSIVHCDVSPHNVLLSREGFVKILDFGVARARFIAAPTSRRLRGKPRYMAPEQTLGETPTSKSDVFVIGILAWELLTGRKLFTGPSVKIILTAVREAPIRNLAILRPDLPESLVVAIMKALDRNPDNRGSARDLAISLASAARSLSMESSPVALADWLDRHCAAPKSEAETAAEKEVIPLTRDTVAGAAFVPLSVAASAFPNANPEAAHSTLPQSTIPGEQTQISIEPTEDDDASGESEIESVDRVSGTPIGDLDRPISSLAGLIDKRRVVIAVLRLDGGGVAHRPDLIRALCDLAYKRGAVIHEQNKEELVAVFGLELAGEDNIASSMQFAVEAAELTRDAIAEGPVIKLRFAARSGVVAQRRQQAYHLRGHALTEARELVRAAEPFRPLLSGGSSRVASAQFQFRELPAMRYRSRRLRVLELIGPSSHDDRRRALRDRRGRFVGREREQEILWKKFQCCLERAEPLGVVIQGEPGIGKSRLIAEFVARVEQSTSPPLLIAVAATNQASAAPLSMAIEHMQAALQLPPGRGEKARATLARKLVSCLRGNIDEDIINEVCQSFELAMEMRDGTLGINEVGASALRKRCAQGIALVHQSLAANRPSLVVLENFHQADEASVEVVRHLLRDNRQDFPCLFVLSCRDELVADHAVESADVIPLKELSDSERSALIADRLIGDTDTPKILEVARRTGGNPLYVEELCRTIREVGWDAMPATIADTVATRVDRLSKRSRAVLQRAAVIGDTFDSSILDELIGTASEPFLRELVEEGFLLQNRQADLQSAGGEFTFRHGLILEVVYSSLSASAKRSTHATLGRLLALRSESGLDEPPAVVAGHLERGGEFLASAYQWCRAGRVAHSGFDRHGARDAFAAALAHLAKARNPPNEESAQAAIDLRREALFGHAKALSKLGDHTQENADLAALEALCAAGTKDHAHLGLRVAQRYCRNREHERALAKANEVLSFAKDKGMASLEGDAQALINLINK